MLEAKLPGAQLFAVADGMGGHAAGELAAHLALKAFAGVVQHQRGRLQQRMIYAAESANQAVYQRATGELSGMGTTLLAAVVSQGALYLAHVGDSRAYLLRGESLFRLTDDHSWVADQLRAGALTPEQACTHHWRNVVSNALGGEERVRLELLSVPLEAGDRLLLCTDGLYGPVGDHKLLTVLGLPRTPEQTAQTLIDLANQAGGPDNISAVIVDILDPGGPPSRPLPRRQEGPVYADQLLRQVQQGSPLSYMLLGTVYMLLLMMALLPMYRLYTALLGLSLLGLLLLYMRYWQAKQEPVLRPEARITLGQPGQDSWSGRGPLNT
ncbi:hypothetical protein GCM10017783_08770 [Deinococcus piscis]|uniref:PPM-type phosphatase domain-containing protein n=1 Tax=Deinococcus piscis TaxID=394230 RepID=A0ABQ3K234_9DEIO|nr:hypothetical protein GCM10017783_08770 [Deinococcus piscis]